MNNVFSAEKVVFFGEKSGSPVEVSVELALEKMLFDTLTLQAETVEKNVLQADTRCRTGCLPARL